MNFWINIVFAIIWLIAFAASTYQFFTNMDDNHLMEAWFVAAAATGTLVGLNLCLAFGW